MSFQSSERILPPIMTIKPSSPISNNVSPTPVLPPVSCLAPPISMPPLMSPITPPADFTKNHNLQSYILPPQNSERTSPRSTSGHYHFHPDAPPSQQQYVDQQRSQSYSPPRVPVSTTQQLPHIPPPSSHHPSMVVRPMHHPYAHPIYHQARPVVDPASELLAEKRRRNAGASARFRDRRKLREREMQEKCQFLERRVQELESMDSAKRIVELEKKLEEMNIEKDVSDQKLREEIQQLRSRLCGEFEFLTPPSSAGEYDSKDILFDNTSKLSRSPSSSSISSEHRKPTDVKSLLS